MAGNTFDWSEPRLRAGDDANLGLKNVTVGWLLMSVIIS